MLPTYSTKQGNRILGTAELDRYLVNNRSIEKLDLTVWKFFFVKQKIINNH